MWAWSGFVLSLVLAAVAWSRSKAPAPTFYEGEVYGLTARIHRRWAFGFAFLGLTLAASAAWSAAQVPLLAALALAGILYGAGFLRGASGEDE